LKDGVAAIVDAFYHLKKKSPLEGVDRILYPLI